MNSSLLIFQSLSDPTRQKILKLLGKEELSVTQICKHFSITQPSISHHLLMMKKAGLVRSKKQGRTVYYYLDKESFLKNCSSVLRDIGIAFK